MNEVNKIFRKLLTVAFIFIVLTLLFSQKTLAAEHTWELTDQNKYSISDIDYLTISGGIGILFDQYPSNPPYITANESCAFSNLIAFSEITPIGNTGSLTYQVSTDNGSTWKYYFNNTWIETINVDGSETSSAPDINSGISTLDTDGGDFIWRAFFNSTGSQTANLDSIYIGTEDNVNHAPKITSNGGYINANINLMEDNTNVTTVIATDQDSGQAFTYSISGGPDKGLFSINANTGVLIFNSAPDYENPTDSNGDNTYDVSIEVMDNGTPIASDSQYISIRVTSSSPSANHAPVITSNGGGDSAYTSIQSGNAAATTVAASDEDSGQTLIYSIYDIGDDKYEFSITSDTGILTFNSAPNYNNPTDSNGDNIYEVIVKVEDGQFPLLFDTQTIFITVQPQSSGGGDIRS